MRILTLLALASPLAAADLHDVVVYGGTSAGVTAAVQAKRMGRSVVVVGPDRHLGGLSAGGLGWTDTGRKGKFDPIPNRKTDTNNHGAFSFDNIGANYDYPEGSYQRRREIIREHERYQKGLLWFLANDPRVPDDIQGKMRRWGLARDEFTDNGNWPHQIYVREARRMVSEFVVTEPHLRRRKPTPRPVGMGSCNMDSHNVQRYADADGHARNEGDIQVSYMPHPNRATNVPVRLTASREVHRFTVNQRERPNADAFHTLDSLFLGGPTTVLIANRETDGHTIVDAVRFVKK